MPKPDTQGHVRKSVFLCSEFLSVPSMMLYATSDCGFNFRKFLKYAVSLHVCLVHSVTHPHHKTHFFSLEVIGSKRQYTVFYLWLYTVKRSFYNALSVIWLTVFWVYVCVHGWLKTSSFCSLWDESVGTEVSLVKNVLGANCPLDWGLGKHFPLLRVNVAFYPRTTAETSRLGLQFIEKQGVILPWIFSVSADPSGKDLHCCIENYSVGQNTLKRMEISLWKVVECIGSVQEAWLVLLGYEGPSRGGGRKSPRAHST